MNFAKHVTLIYFLTLTNLKSEIKKFYVSYLWWIIEPVVNMAVYYFVFGVLLNQRESGFVYFLLVGLIIWRWFSGAILQSSNALVQSRGLIKRVALPKYIFPSVAVFAQSFKFLFVFTILVVFLWFNGFHPSMHYLGLIPLMAAQLVLIIGISFLTAALVPFMEDLRLLINSGMMMLFFLSGIFFSGSKLESHLQPLFYINPLAKMVESYRVILLDNAWPEPKGILILLACGLVALSLGVFLLKRLDHLYPKVLR